MDEQSMGAVPAVPLAEVTDEGITADDWASACDAIAAREFLDEGLSRILHAILHSLPILVCFAD